MVLVLRALESPKRHIPPNLIPSGLVLLILAPEELIDVLGQLSSYKTIPVIVRGKVIVRILRGHCANQLPVFSDKVPLDREPLTV